MFSDVMEIEKLKKLYRTLPPSLSLPHPRLSI